jgi:hypothetical protein
MIPSKVAEAMPYLEYKQRFWSLMLAWWQRYLPEHPERGEFVAERIAIAEAQVAKWDA